MSSCVCVAGGQSSPGLLLISWSLSFFSQTLCLLLCLGICLDQMLHSKVQLNSNTFLHQPAYPRNRMFHKEHPTPQKGYFSGGCIAAERLLAQGAALGQSWAWCGDQVQTSCLPVSALFQASVGKAGWLCLAECMCPHGACVSQLLPALCGC